MKILYIADGRSPTALNWMSYFINSSHEVHLASTFPCQPVKGLASFEVIPMALNAIYVQSDRGTKTQRTLLKKLIPVSLRTRIRQLTAPLSFFQAVKALQLIMERVQPDLIHAMRIPFEGMVASMARTQSQAKSPMLVSVWGNDFTLHARSSAAMHRYTRQVLKLCDGLHTDCQRDLDLAMELGFESSKPAVVLPGGGGIKLDIFYPPEEKIDIRKTVMIINPRGFRAYIRNDTFFKAIPLVLEQNPNTHFICTGMAGEAQAHKWVKDLEIESWVDLLPAQTQIGMADLFRRSLITLSISMHDGTPNTLLEAMACGCFPIAGDIDSLREWIKPSVNGLLVDPSNPRMLAEAILTALSHSDLRKQAKTYNLELVSDRAEYSKTMREAESLYTRLLALANSKGG